MTLVRLALPCVVALGLGYVVVAIKDALWRALGVTLASWNVGSLPFYVLWIVVGVVAQALVPTARRVPWRSQRRDSTALIVVIVGSVLTYLPALVRFAGGRAHAPESVFALLGGGLVGPIVEEWLFRGVLWNVLRPVVEGRRGAWLTVALTSVVFGLFHLSFEGHSVHALGQVVVHAAFGALMGFGRWRLEGIAVGCATHALGNSLMIATFT